MARITIEDCIEKVPNRFQLVQMAAIRAKQLKRGASAFVDQDNKEVVTALREIAAGVVRPDEFTENVLFGSEGEGLGGTPESAARDAATLEAEALFASSPEAPATSQAEAPEPVGEEAAGEPNEEPEPAS